MKQKLPQLWRHFDPHISRGLSRCNANCTQLIASTQNMHATKCLHSKHYHNPMFLFKTSAQHNASIENKHKTQRLYSNNTNCCLHVQCALLFSRITRVLETGSHKPAKSYRKNCESRNALKFCPRLDLFEDILLPEIFVCFGLQTWRDYCTQKTKALTAISIYGSQLVQQCVLYLVRSMLTRNIPGQAKRYFRNTTNSSTASCFNEKYLRTMYIVWKVFKNYWSCVKNVWKWSSLFGQLFVTSSRGTRIQEFGTYCKRYVQNPKWLSCTLKHRLDMPSMRSINLSEFSIVVRIGCSWKWPKYLKYGHLAESTAQRQATFNKLTGTQNNKALESHIFNEPAKTIFHF